MAGEKSGTLEPVLRRYVAYAKVLAAVKRKTLSALIYPAILVGLSLIVVTIIMVQVVPEFAGFYAQFGRELPLSTRLLVGASTIATDWFFVITAVAIGAGVGIWVLLRRPEQKTRFDRLILAVPLAGPTVRKFATSQAARTLATLLGGGIPLVSALGIASRSIGNQYMARELASTEQQVREGRALAAAMADSGAFPDVSIKMVEVGESTGALQEMLASLADFYDEEIETNLGRFVTMIEPALLVVMGIVIAGLLLSLYMPLFQLSSVMGR
jgi:type IV pilus assembly protein PilC